MGVPDDVNPLNRRLPAEVITRQHKPEKRRQREEEAPLETDRAQVLALKPEHRVKWLSKALQKGQEGKASMTTLYDIIAHTKFGLAASEKIGRNMYKIVRANLPLFSQKQQRFLEIESKLAKDFARSRAPTADVDGQDLAATYAPAEEADAGSGGLPADEIPMLCSRLSMLPPFLCNELIDTLDPVTRELLEDFLETRMRAKHAVSANAAAPALAGRGRRASHSSRSRSRSGSSDAAVRKQEAKGKKEKDADRSKRARCSSSKSSSKASSSSSASRQRRRSRSHRGKSRREKR